MEPLPETTVDLVAHDDAVRITVVGDLDLSVAHLPQQLLAEHLEQGGAVREVVVDLHAVGFVDSTGLGGLIRVRHETAPPGSRVVLEGANARVRQLLAMTGLDRDFVLTD